MSAPGGLVPDAEYHFGLPERPFSPAPDPRFTYQSHSWREARDELVDAMQRRDTTVLITGAAGTGKTMLCRTLLQHLPSGTFLSVITNPKLTADELVEQMLTDFGVIRKDASGARPAGVTHHQLVMVLHRFLVSLSSFETAAIVVIDEAHHLDPQVIEQLRLLSNVEVGGSAPLQIILVGQPELHTLLARPELYRFNERISRHIELRPLSAREVSQYVEHRLNVAYGSTFEPQGEPGKVLQLSQSSTAIDTWRVRFTPSALGAVTMLSNGVPRRVSMICERALEIAHRAGGHTVTSRIVLTAASRLEPRRPARRWLTPKRGAVAATILALLVAGPAAWAAWRTSVPAVASVAVPASTAIEPAAVVPGTPSVGTLQVINGVVVAVAAFGSERQAADLVSRIAASGLPAFIRVAPGAQAYEAVVGPYVTFEEASAVQEWLGALGHSMTRLDNGQ